MREKTGGGGVGGGNSDAVSDGTPEDAPPPDMADVTETPPSLALALRSSSPKQASSGGGRGGARIAQGGPRRTKQERGRAADLRVDQYAGSEATTDNRPSDTFSQSGPLKNDASQSAKSISNVSVRSRVSNSTQGSTGGKSSGTSTAKKMCRHRILRTMCVTCRDSPKGRGGGGCGSVDQVNTSQVNIMLGRDSYKEQEKRFGSSSDNDSDAQSNRSSQLSLQTRQRIKEKNFTPPEINVRDHVLKTYTTTQPNPAKVKYKTTIDEMLAILDEQYTSTVTESKLTIRTQTADKVAFDGSDVVSSLPANAVLTYTLTPKRDREGGCCAIC